MDEWTEVLPPGSNVWIIPREMYSSVCLCVSNRTSEAQLVLVDCSGSRGVNLLAAESDRIKDQPYALRRVIPASQTEVVGVLSPDLDPATALVRGEGEREGTGREIIFFASVSSRSVEGELGGAIGDRGDAHRTMLESEQQSAEVAQFLQSRRQRQ
jgi:hypothetical protein